MKVKLNKKDIGVCDNCNNDNELKYLFVHELEIGKRFKLILCKKCLKELQKQLNENNKFLE